MKIFMIMLTVLLMGFSCESVELENEIIRIEFNSVGMSGYAENIKITNDSIILTIEQRRTQETSKTYQRKINKEEWSNLISTIEDLNFSEITTLESPTMKRAYDGAMHSEITISTINKEYVSPSFDDDDPHERLQPLMDAIRTLANTVHREE